MLIVPWNLVAKYSDLDLVQRLCSAVGHLSYLLRRRRREEAKQSMPVWALGLGLAACDMESIKKKSHPSLCLTQFQIFFGSA